MRRVTLSPPELAGWLSAELRSTLLADAKVTAVRPLPEPDTSGCNWSDEVAVDPGAAEPARAQRAARRIAADARRWFNLC
ncbi:MAG: hypothetical protein ACK5TK_15250 [Betaproteobacteria bacterium]